MKIGALIDSVWGVGLPVLELACVYCIGGMNLSSGSWKELWKRKGHFTSRMSLLGHLKMPTYYGLKMFILPFYYRTVVSHSVSLYQIVLLTLAGKHLWSEEDTLRICEDILTPNGLVMKRPPFRQGDIVFCEVDVTKMDMADFYQWDELEELELDDGSSPFCWRTFYRVGSAIEGLPPPSTERLEPYACKEVLDQILASLATS